MHFQAFPRKIRFSTLLPPDESQEQPETPIAASCGYVLQRTSLGFSSLHLGIEQGPCT
jgi:hypothetical protein